MKEESNKTSFSLNIYKYIFKDAKNVQELFVRSFLIRPTWLSTLALIKTLKTFKSTQQVETQLVPELKVLFDELPNKPQRHLVQADPDLQLMFMYYLHTTFPTVVISRMIMVDAKGLSAKVKWMPLKFPPNPKPLKREVIFDNNVGIKSRHLLAIIKKCMDLLNRLQCAPEKVQQPYQVWHFLGMKTYLD